LTYLLSVALHSASAYIQNVIGIGPSAAELSRHIDILRWRP